MLLAGYVFPAVVIGVPTEEPLLLTHNNSHPHTKALKHTHTPITQTHTYKHTPTRTQTHTHTHTHTHAHTDKVPRPQTQSQKHKQTYTSNVHTPFVCCINLYVSHPPNTHTPRKKSLGWMVPVKTHSSFRKWINIYFSIQWERFVRLLLFMTKTLYRSVCETIWLGYTQPPVLTKWRVISSTRYFRTLVHLYLICHGDQRRERHQSFEYRLW